MIPPQNPIPSPFIINNFLISIESEITQTFS